MIKTAEERIAVEGAYNHSDRVLNTVTVSFAKYHAMIEEAEELRAALKPQAQQSQWISLRNDDYSHLKGNELIYAYRHGQGIFEARLENYRVVSDVTFNRNVNGITHIMVRPPLPCPPSAEKVFNDEIHRPWAQPPAPEGGE